MELKLVATREEKLKLVNDCLTTGLPTLALSGFELKYRDADYKASRQNLIDGGMKEDEICLEDVQANIIAMGNALTFIDHEDGGKKTSLTMARIDRNWGKIRSREAQDYISENWDSDTADNMMQCLLFGEIVYG